MVETMQAFSSSVVAASEANAAALLEKGGGMDERKGDMSQKK